MALPLDAFVAEVVRLLSQSDIPDEILVERVAFLRNAEAEGRFDTAFKAING